MREPPLTADELNAALTGPDGPRWQLENGALTKTVACGTFVGSLAFVASVGELAEAADHHPDIDIRYATVILRLVTHDSGGITRLDLDLARAIDAIPVGS
jgi:4a-hydroxytetrahydrobiopterin dehydratase